MKKEVSERNLLFYLIKGARLDLNNNNNKSVVSKWSTSQVIGFMKKEQSTL